MKRLIKYWSTISSDEHSFSECSSRYEILPELVSDEAGGKELRALAKKYNIEIRTYVFTREDGGRSRHGLTITHAVKVEETKSGRGMYSDEKYQVYLGFITLPKADGTLKPLASLDNPVTHDQAIEIVNLQEYGVDNYGETMDGAGDQCVLVKSGWNYDHEISFLGYSLESFEKSLGITEHGFYDDTENCSECGKFDSRDNGYTYNFRYVECKGNLGINCGCFDEFCESEEAIEHYKDNTEECMNLTGAKALTDKGKLKHLERFIWGMVDGRGGYYAGKATREGDPKSVLEEYQTKYPKKSFVFTHDESGQFQTYFSIWEVTQTKAKKKKST